jgi:hypothetical protein
MLSTNIIIVLALLSILLLTYLKNNNFELFGNDTSGLVPGATSTNTIPLLINDVIHNSPLVNFINRFIVNKNQQNSYMSVMSERQRNINNLSGKVISLINPTI